MKLSAFDLIKFLIRIILPKLLLLQLVMEFTPQYVNCELTGTFILMRAVSTWKMM